MPNIASAKKRTRTTAKRTAINTSRKTRVRGFVRKVEEALAKGDRTAAEAALKAAEPEIMRGVSKGVLHKNTGARKVSRLTKRVANGHGDWTRWVGVNRTGAIGIARRSVGLDVSARRDRAERKEARPDRRDSPPMGRADTHVAKTPRRRGRNSNRRR